MGKQALTQKETKVKTVNGEGMQLERTVTYDENGLPSAQELEEYKKINPHIIEHILTTSSKEQEFRHDIVYKKMDLVRQESRHILITNIIGMSCAVICVLFIVALAGFALYKDRPWFAGLSAFLALVSIVGIFIGKNKK